MSNIATKRSGVRHSSKETGLEYDGCECGSRRRKDGNDKNGLEIGELREFQSKAIDSIVANMQHVGEEVWNNDTTLFDSHCHLQLDPLYENASEAIALALQLGVKHMSICGTEPGNDWQKVIALAEAYPDIVIPSFGLHPWWIKEYYPPSQDNSSLKGYPI